MVAVTQLVGIPLFAGFSPEELAFIATVASERLLAPQEPAVWVGDATRELFVILEGRAEVVVPDEAGRELRIAVLGPGESFGELAVFDGGPRTTTVRALTPLKLVVFPQPHFEQCLRQLPGLALAFLRVLAGRHRAMLEQLRGFRNLNQVIEQEISGWQKVANFIADIAASRGFLLTHAVFFSAWIVANVVLGARAWDPYPFLFLCFWASVEAIFLSLFILVSQATQSQKDRLRNELDYQVAVKLQFEVMQLHQKLDAWRNERNPGN